VVINLIESVMLKQGWEFRQAGHDRDLDIVIELGKQMQNRPLRLDGGIRLLSLAGSKTLVEFYSGPRGFTDFVLADRDYKPDVDFIRQVKDAIVERFIELGLLKSSEDDAKGNVS